MKNLVDLDLWFSNISVYQNHLDDLVDKNVAFLFSWGQGHNHILVTYGILWKCQVLTTALPEKSTKFSISSKFSGDNAAVLGTLLRITVSRREWNINQPCLYQTSSFVSEITDPQASLTLSTWILSDLLVPHICMENCMPEWKLHDMILGGNSRFFSPTSAFINYVTSQVI